MSESERSPLIGPEATTVTRANRNDEDSISESAPLLSDTTATPRYDGAQDGADHDGAETGSQSLGKPSKKSVPWPSIIAMLVLAIIAIFIMLLAFFLPAAVEQYAKEAAVLEPTNLSLESITANGIKARIRANFRLDGSRVKDDNSRRLGRFATSIVRKLGTDDTQISVYLPEFKNTLLGSAAVPPLVLDVVDGHTTTFDFVADVSPGDAEAYRRIANDWLEGKLGRIKLFGKADIRLKSGILPLGTHPVAETLVVEAKEIPDLPSYNITRLNFHDVPSLGGDKGAVGADVSITAYNDFPVSLTVPELGFQVLVPNCDPSDDPIAIADAITKRVNIQAHSNVTVDAQGLVRGLPKSLTRACPHTKSSPLDNFLQGYLHGKRPTVYVRGKTLPESKVPHWLSDILSDITVPVPFPGHGFDSFIREFSLSDVNFKLPGPLTDPEDDDGSPRVSGTVEVLAALPKEMNLEVNVTGIRATADVLYRKQKMGVLKLDPWNPANSTILEDERTKEPLVKILSRVEDAPLQITDSDVFSEVMQEMFFGNKKIMLDVKAKVDTQVETALGLLIFKDIPAEGRVPLKPLPHDALGSLQPEVGEIKILHSTSKSIDIEARVNVTNPTPYTAYIPYLNVYIAKNGTILGSATVEHLNFTKGNNENVLVRATWSTSAWNGIDGRNIGRELFSQYISGHNATIDIKGHAGSVPAVPLIGEALSKLNISVPIPKLDLPGEDGQEGKFIRDALFHLFSSTATFTLVSPLHYNTIYVDAVNATAYYNHTEPVGKITYDIPFAATPGATRTPRLPVDWSIGSIGYEAMKKALGGDLKLDAKANVTVRIGSWRETFWYDGKGIGAHVSL